MEERRQPPPSPLEARQALWIIREQAKQDLDRDLASELRIASTIDLAHPAHPDQCLYLKGAEAPQPLVLVSCQRRLKQLVDLMPAFSRHRPSRARLSARHL